MSEAAHNNDQEGQSIPPSPRGGRPAKKMWRTKAREALTPYLPPPVIAAMGRLDAQLGPTVGPEATVTLSATLLFMWITMVVLKFVARRLSGGGQGRAIAGEDEDHVLSLGAGGGRQSAPFDYTVLLCGPPGAGKTRLFYYFCTGDKNMPTLTSLKANVGMAAPAASGPTDDAAVRYLDWPGHASLVDKALDPLWKQPLDQVRVILVLDATQKVAAAAAVLYEIWQEAVLSNRRKRRHVLIACHKQDFPKAKNCKRIKIQLRTELERLVTTNKPSWWNSASKEVELDSLPGLQVSFVPTSCEAGNHLAPLEAYCRHGQLPVDAAAATS